MKKYMLKSIVVIIAIGILLTAFTVIRATMPQTARPEEVNNPTITMDASGQRYLQIDIYAGHSALNPEGAKLKEKGGVLFVKPVYCLINSPINLCKPDVLTEYLDAPKSSEFTSVRLSLPDKPEKVSLVFRYGELLDVN